MGGPWKAIRKWNFDLYASYCNIGILAASCSMMASGGASSGYTTKWCLFVSGGASVLIVGRLPSAHPVRAGRPQINLCAPPQSVAEYPVIGSDCNNLSAYAEEAARPSLIEARGAIGHHLGPLVGGPQCRISILRKDNVTYLCRLFSQMSHVKFKKRQVPSHYILSPPCRMSLFPMSHVEIKKCPCRPAILGVRGQSPIAAVRWRPRVDQFPQFAPDDLARRLPHRRHCRPPPRVSITSALLLLITCPLQYLWALWLAEGPRGKGWVTRDD